MNIMAETYTTIKRRMAVVFLEVMLHRFPCTALSEGLPRTLHQLWSMLYLRENK
jgi:hypothetical protein